VAGIEWRWHESVACAGVWAAPCWRGRGWLRSGRARSPPRAGCLRSCWSQRPAAAAAAAAGAAAAAAGAAAAALGRELGASGGCGPPLGWLLRWCGPSAPCVCPPVCTTSRGLTGARCRPLQAGLHYWAQAGDAWGDCLGLLAEVCKLL
jgi:hypothetical protein